MAKRRIRIDDVFHALGDSTRRAIVERLSAGPATVSALAAMLAISVTAVGQHLQILESSGLSITEKTGRVRTCRIDSRGFSMVDAWIAGQRAQWQQRLDRLAEVLDEDDAPEV